MSKKNRLCMWQVVVEGVPSMQIARTPGAAARKAFRDLRKFPATSGGGGWKKTTITLWVAFAK